jgi:ribosomal protein S25
MGTKGKKPLSTLEKRQRKLVKEETKKVAKEEKKERKTVSITGLDPAMITKVIEEVKNTGFATPFTLSQKLGVKYSIARKLLKELVKSNDVELVAKNRRIILITKK